MGAFKYISLAFSLVIAMAAASLSRADAPLSNNSTTFDASPEANELREFLYRLGFEDLSAQIKATQKSEGSMNEMTRRQQEQNYRSYQTINASRELAILVFQSVQASLKNQKDLDLFIDFTAKMLDLHRIPPTTNYPAEIMNIPHDEAKSIVLADWLAKQRRKVMAQQTTDIVADILTVTKQTQSLDDALTRRLFSLTGVIVDRMYFDSLIGDTKFLGRALAGLLARYAHQNDRPDIMKALSKSARSKGQYLQNFIGTTWIIEDKSGLRRVPVENGSMILTRYMDFESLAISIGAFPSKFKDLFRAQSQGMRGNFLAAPFFVEPEDLADGLKLSHKIKNAISQSDVFFNSGLSHIGWVNVKEDPSTGIKMSWTFDCYGQMVADLTSSESNKGGVRLSGLEQFLNPSHHSRIYIGHIDPAKYYKWSQQTVEKLGYPKDGVLFEATVPVLKDGVFTVDEKAPLDPWKTEISEKDFFELHRVQNTETWYKTVSTRFTNQMTRFITQGVFFQWIEDGVYLKGGAYCSQIGELAMAVANGLSLEQNPTRWHPIVAIVASIGRFAQTMIDHKILPKIAEKVLNNPEVQKALTLQKMNVIAPNSMAAQSFMKGASYALKTRTIEERAKWEYEPYHPYDSKFSQELDQHFDNRRFHLARFNPVEKAAANIMDIEYGYVMRAVRGGNTSGVDTEYVAEHGSDLGLKTMIARMIRKKGTADTVRCSKVLLAL
jgi:hypothetical protein